MTPTGDGRYTFKLYGDTYEFFPGRPMILPTSGASERAAPHTAEAPTDAQGEPWHLAPIFSVRPPTTTRPMPFYASPQDYVFNELRDAILATGAADTDEMDEKLLQLADYAVNDCSEEFISEQMALAEARLAAGQPTLLDRVREAGVDVDHMGMVDAMADLIKVAKCYMPEDPTATSVRG